jgi:hypothetical protein
MTKQNIYINFCLNIFSKFYLFCYIPQGIRIPVTYEKKRCPRPLDDGGCFLVLNNFIKNHFYDPIINTFLNMSSF